MAGYNRNKPHHSLIIYLKGKISASQSKWGHLFGSTLAFSFRGPQYLDYLFKNLYDLLDASLAWGIPYKIAIVKGIKNMLYISY